MVGSNPVDTGRIFRECKNPLSVALSRKIPTALLHVKEPSVIIRYHPLVGPSRQYIRQKIKWHPVDGLWPSLHTSATLTNQTNNQPTKRCKFFFTFKFHFKIRLL